MISPVCVGPAHVAADPPAAYRPRIRAMLARGALLLATLSAAAQPALCAAPEPPLTRDPALTFSVLLPQALQRTPEYLTLAARDQEAAAHVAAARSWLAGRPSLEASHTRDRLRSGAGATESDYALQLPLWRPGERRDAQRLASAVGQEAKAWRAYLELTVAGQLRECLAALARAERVAALERTATTEAERLAQTVERLFAAGETTALDVAQIRTALLTQQRQALDAQHALARAEATYVWLTGLTALPAAPHREAPAAHWEITPDHPWLAYLAASVTVTEGNIQRARVAARGNPALALGGKRERGAQGEPYLDSVVLGLSVPFGGRAHVDAAVTSAQRQRTEAQVTRQSAERDLRQQLDTARRELATLAATERLAAEQVAVDRGQWQMAQAAFAAGETTLLQVLSALRQYRLSQREHDLLTLRRDSLTAHLNHIVGDLP